MKKDLNNWVVKSLELDGKTFSTFERTSLTRVLSSFIKLLSGVKYFVIAIPDVKTYVIYRKNTAGKGVLTFPLYLYYNGVEVMNDNGGLN